MIDFFNCDGRSSIARWRSRASSTTILVGRDRADLKGHHRSYCWGLSCAQLLSVAYGAEYEHSPERKIGVSRPWRLEDYRSACCWVWSNSETGHRHGDMPGLTEDVVVLRPAALSVDGFALVRKNIGAFQALHLEFDPEAVDLWLLQTVKLFWKSKPDLVQKPRHSKLLIVEKWMPNSMHFDSLTN